MGREKGKVSRERRKGIGELRRAEENARREDDERGKRWGEVDK